MRGALTALALLLSGFAAHAGAQPAAAAGSGDAFRDALQRELNRVRAVHKLPRVSADARLAGGAAAHSSDMARRRYFSHGPWTGRVRAASSGARSIGEVIGWMAVRHPRAEAAYMVRAWLNSPPHRAVLLGRGFARVGIGRAVGTQGRLRTAIYTADFASRR